MGFASALAFGLGTPSANAQSANEQHVGENGRDPGRSTVTIALTYAGDVNADVEGGERRGTAYLQRVGLLADADLDRLVGWHGAVVHASVHSIVGQGLSQHRAGNVLTVSGIEAEPALRLFNLWVQQSIGSNASVRIGQFTAAQEFAVSPTANLFVNSTFGWPGSFATDLPDGGPAYPLGAPGVRVQVALDDRVTIRSAMFAGDPAGPGDGDPQRRDVHGLNGLRFAGRPFVVSEIAASSAEKVPTLTLTLGGWWHFDTFADQRLDDWGQSLASPRTSGAPIRHSGNFAAYAIADAQLWSSPSVLMRSIRAFVRTTISPPNRNSIGHYLDAGLSIAAPFAGRTGDVAGVAIAWAAASRDARRLVVEQTVTSAASLPTYEAVVEASYRVQIGGNRYIQPNVQYIVHPGSAIANATVLPDALVVGLRTSTRF